MDSFVKVCQLWVQFMLNRRVFLQKYSCWSLCYLLIFGISEVFFVNSEVFIGLLQTVGFF
jgi:hypothetical protein